ncbi:MAG: Dabb family protein [Verrucomicrobiota bacterium]|jgi:predicted alpha-1,6-mannanase (GH76 family)|nr:Dabb family protein [Verrucomicrobiota bacterium]MDP7048178.1 Dabb family protein [Verrucomicrobiota bacterium]
MKNILRLLGLAVGLGVLYAGMTTEAADKKQVKQLRHFVCFKYKDEATMAKIAEVEKAFAALEKKITEIKAFEKGTNNSPEGLNKGFKHCYLITFGSEKDRDIYLVHPAHKKFVELVGPVVEDVFVVDYWAGK